MKHSDSIKEIATALAKAQGELGGAAKDSENPHFKSKYADLQSNVAALKACFPKHGLSYVQTPVSFDSGIGVETLLMHSSGEWILGEGWPVPVDKASAHGVGSALTYARRYSLAAACGIAPEDDDGNAATSAPPAARVMSSAVFGAHKIAIGTALDEVALKKAYTAAYVDAQSLRDNDAITRLTDLKDLRKQELHDLASVKS